MSLKFNRAGSASLILILLAMGALSASTLAMSMALQQRKRIFSREYSSLIVEETAKSAIILMESALERRLWEPPPDSTCLKQENFYLTGSTPSGVTYRVDADFDFNTNTLTLISRANSQGSTLQFEKKTKILDVADFLNFTKKTNPPAVTQINRNYSNSDAIGMIAKHRKLYIENPVTFYGVNAFSNDTQWSGTAINVNDQTNPRETGVIFQGERMTFLGGIRQLEGGDLRGFFPSEASSLNISRMLSSMCSPDTQAQAGINEPCHTLYGRTSAFFTEDYAEALTIRDAVRSTSSSPPPIIWTETLKKKIYPITLFSQSTWNLPGYDARDRQNGSSYPLFSRGGIDNGGYIPGYSPRVVSTWTYSDNNFGARRELTCLMSDPTQKHCNNSNHFPNGFDAWRSDASLNQILFTTDGTELNYKPLNWDNYEALKEDALACGVVLDPSSLPGPEDCDLSNLNLIDRYITLSSSNGNPCQRIREFDLDELVTAGLNSASVPKLTNFNLGQLNDPALKKRLLRRVIYAPQDPADTYPTQFQLKQDQTDGIFSSISLNAARRNLNLWIVSEGQLVIRPFQKDLTSPLETQPERLRKVFFNLDGDEAPTTDLVPVNLVLLSPEIVQIITPQRVPITFSELQLSLPVVPFSGQGGGKKIYPQNQIFTDAFHQENDGFKYGLREVMIGSTSIVGQSKAQGYNGYFLRGLWSALDSSAEQALRNACMVHRPEVDNSSQGLPYRGYNYGNFGINTAHEHPTHWNRFNSLESSSGPGDAMPFASSRYYRSTLCRQNNPTYISTDESNFCSALATNNFLGLNPTTAVTGTLWYPYVFQRQSAAHPTGARESTVSHQGSVIFTQFSSTPRLNANPGMRTRLDQTYYSPYNVLTFQDSTSGRVTFQKDPTNPNTLKKTAWALSYWYEQSHPSAPNLTSDPGYSCNQSVKTISGSPYFRPVFLNHSNRMHFQRSIDDETDRVGSIFGVSLPLTQAPVGVAGP